MTFSPDQQIGAYRIIRLLGEGGMGAVYEVEHAELGTHYALKTFVYDGADEYADMLLNKFREEAKILSRINHPNVSRAFDLTHDKERGVLYYVMDLVLYKDGESYSLGEVDRASLTEDHVYRWFCDACAALDHIHSLGIVHRDVKLDNFLLNPDKHAVLADFGVSRIFGKQMKKDVAPYKTMRIKRSGSTEVTVLGSDHYVAPEVLAGQEATPAADAYGLGIMIFKLFTDEWADKKSPAQVDAFLHGYKYRWYKVVPRLLEFDPAKRPTELSDLIGLLDREPAPVAAAKPKVAPHGKRTLFFTLLAGLIAIVSAGLICGGLYTGGKYAWERFNEYQAEQNRIRRAQYEAQLKAKEEQDKKLTEMEKRLDAQRANVATQVVMRVVEDDGRDLVAELDDLLSSEPTESEKPEKTTDAPAQKEKMEIVGKVEERVDYGPIPQVKYKWFAGGNAHVPNKVAFALANKSTIDLVPMRKGSFLLLNPPNQGKVYHRVTLTRPYWLSKYCVTVENLKDITPDGFGDYDKLGVALQGKYPLYLRRSRQEIENYCKHLTAKYRSLLPDGYVFRLPTEAELCFAINEDKARSLYGTDWFNKVDTEANGDGVLPSFAKVIKELGLESFGKWSWGSKLYTGNDWLMVGGVTDPLPSGVCDLVGGPLWTLEKMDPGTLYLDDEQDPVRLDTAPDARCLVINKRGRVFTLETDRFNFHVVLAPVLTEDHAIIASQSAEAVVPKAKPRKYAWRTPNKISHPLEMTFKLENGADLLLCYCPKGKFNMSNVDGQDNHKHLVEITKPFWVSKFCVGAKQWRDFAKYDCEGQMRELEEAAPAANVFRMFDRVKWNAYCEFLTERYRDLLPAGYVFRLPTEAEWEYAYTSGGTECQEGDGGEDWRQYCWGTDNLRPLYERFEKRNKKLKRFSDWRIYGVRGEYPHIYYVGGWGKPNRWGLCDFWIGCNGEMHVLDAFERDRGCGVDPVKDIEYAQGGEVDPLRWVGSFANRGLTRLAKRRVADGLYYCRPAHIVLAPDILAPLKKKELEPYPSDDFGGRRISDKCTIGGFSSLANGWKDAERHKKLLTPEPLEKNTDTRAFHTEREKMPWVQINMPEKVQVVGLVVEARGDARGNGWNRSAQLVVWVSDDMKTWREAIRNEQNLHRYRFDLSKKVVKGKYLRIGRDSKTNRTDWFHLNKVIIYGK